MLLAPKPIGLTGFAVVPRRDRGGRNWAETCSSLDALRDRFAAWTNSFRFGCHQMTCPKAVAGFTNLGYGLIPDPGQSK